MQGRLRARHRPAGTLTVEALEGLRALDGVTDQPILLAYHPVARVNPYQAMLYREAWGAGIAAIPVMAEEEIDELAAIAASGVLVVLHVHWLNHPRRDSDAPDRDAERFLERIDRFLAAGGRLAWTVHNVLPHAAFNDAAAARVHQAIADRADVIHVMAAETAAYVEPHYHLPRERILHVPHPSYAGAYPAVAGREQARHELELRPDELVFLLLGAIKPYKGTADLLDAWESLPVSPLRRLVIVGGPSEDAGIEDVLRRATVHPTISLHARKLPPDMLALFLEAADVAVLPYTRSLNSGALMLALTFGLPVIVPSGGAIADLVEDSHAITYDRERPGALAEALHAATRLRAPEAREAARAAAAASDPIEVSRAFAAGLRSRVLAAAGLPGRGGREPAS